MTISIDTNVISALWNDDDPFNGVAVQMLHTLLTEERLVVSGTVYAELMAGPLRDEASLDLFFEDTGIEIDWAMEEDVWRLAGRAYLAYVQCRKRSGGGDARRILTDFLIGAHAQVRGNTMLTLDKELYRVSFPRLQIYSI